MKIAVQKTSINDLILSIPYPELEGQSCFLGYIDLPIEKPKESIDDLVGRVSKVFLDEVQVKPYYVKNEGGNRLSVHLYTPEKPKKTVVKEAQLHGGYPINPLPCETSQVQSWVFPPRASNIKPPTYEIDE